MVVPLDVGLGQGHGQQAVLEARRHLAPVHGDRQPHAPGEHPMGAVDPVMLLVLLVLFLPLLAIDRQQVLLQRDLNVLGSIPGTSTFAIRLSSVSETSMVGAHSAPAGYSSSHLPSRKWAPYLAFAPPLSFRA
jgi:hypothetical protein